jgi:hypothetical protein
MIGYYCYMCGHEHAYLGDCPYDKASGKTSYDYSAPRERETESVSIPRHMQIGETVTVYLSGGIEITLKRTK